jgi:hypothetical protein
MSCEFFTTAPDILHTAILPVSEQIVQAAMRACELPNLFKDNIRIESYGTVSANKSSDHTDPDYSRNRLVIQASYSLNPAALRWPTAHLGIRGQELTSSPGARRLQLKPILTDTVNKIQLHNYDQPMALGLACRFEYVDVMHAMECLQRFQAFASEGIVEFEADYTYHLPAEIYGLIGLLYKQAGLDLAEFLTYLETNSNKQIGLNLNRDDMTDTAIAVRCTRAKCVAAIEITQDIPEPLGGYRSPKAYAVSVNIQAQINMPNTLGLRYPITLNNTMVPKELLPFTTKDYDVYRDKEYPYLHIEAYRQLTAGVAIVEPLRYPWYDDWQPNLSHSFRPGLVGIFLLEDPANPEGVTVLDLPGGYTKVLPEIWDLYRLVGRKCLGYNTFLNISVFKDDILLDPEDIGWSDDLALTISERDLRCTYRVVLSYDPTGFPTRRGVRKFDYTITPHRDGQ